MRDKLNHSIAFIFQCTVISSKMFFQFWREMKIQYCQVGSIWWVIQDSETNTLILALVGVKSSTVRMKERLLHMRMNSSKSHI
jgi:hypothetical protein